MVRMERKPTRKKMGSDMNNSSRYETHVVSKHAMCARHEQEGEENDFGVIFLVKEKQDWNRTLPKRMLRIQLLQMFNGMEDRSDLNHVA